VQFLILNIYYQENVRCLLAGSQLVGLVVKLQIQQTALIGLNIPEFQIYLQALIIFGDHDSIHSQSGIRTHDVFDISGYDALEVVGQGFVQHVPDNSTEPGIHELFTLADVEVIDQIPTHQLKVSQTKFFLSIDSAESTIHYSHSLVFNPD
jgi:hypothetical protein